MYTNDNCSCKEFSTILEKYGLGGTAVTDCLVAARNNLGNKALDCCLSEAAKTGKLSELTNCPVENLSGLLGDVAAGLEDRPVYLSYTKEAAAELKDALSSALRTYIGKPGTFREFDEGASTIIPGEIVPKGE